MDKMDLIKVCYIDDNLDPYLSEYLLNLSEIENFEYCEYNFDTDSDGFKTLLDNEQVIDSQIILIDSWLFQSDSTLEKGRLTGQQFKVLLKRYFPYKEVIVVSMNEQKEVETFISKFTATGPEADIEADKYYQRELLPVIKESIKNIKMTDEVIEVLKLENTDVDQVLIEKISDTSKGIRSKEELTKSDIDQLIEIFKEVKTSYE